MARRAEAQSTIGGDGSHEHELILHLAGTAARRKGERGRIEELAARADLVRLSRILERQRLSALVGARLRDACPWAVDDRFRSFVRDALESDRAWARPASQLSRFLAAELEGAGVPALQLKGSVLARAIYGDPGWRRCSDVDLLVHPEQLEHAATLIEAHGFERVRDVRWAHGRPHLHHTLVHRVGWLPAVDLHWRIHWYETGFSTGMLARSRPCDGDGRRPLPADDLAALLLFFQRDSFFGLRYAADLAAWWDARAGELGERALDPLLADHPELRQAVLAATAVAERLVGLPQDALVSGRFRCTRRARLAARLANWPQRGDRRTAATVMSLVDGLLSPRGGRRGFLRRYLFQPAPVFAAAHGLPEGARVRAQLWRAAHGAARSLRIAIAYARTAWTVRGGREWAPHPAGEWDG